MHATEMTASEDVGPLGQGCPRKASPGMYRDRSNLRKPGWLAQSESEVGGRHHQKMSLPDVVFFLSGAFAGRWPVSKNSKMESGSSALTKSPVLGSMRASSMPKGRGKMSLGIITPCMAGPT